MHSWGSHQAMDSQTLFLPTSSFFFHQAGEVLLVSGMVKGFQGHKLGNFTHPSLNCEGKKYIHGLSNIYMVFLGFPTPAHPHVGLDSLQDQSQRFQFVREPKAAATCGWERLVTSQVGSRREC